MITEYIHVETGSGGTALITASNLVRMTAGEYRSLEDPADDTLYITFSDGAPGYMYIDGIYQGGNRIYKRGYSGFDLYYMPFESTAFACSDGPIFAEAGGRELFVRV